MSCLEGLSTLYVHDLNVMLVDSIQLWGSCSFLNSTCLPYIYVPLNIALIYQAGLKVQ